MLHPAAAVSVRIFPHSFALALLCLGACSSSAPPATDKPVAVPFVSTCTAGMPPSDATLPAGRLPDGSVILPGGRRLSPAGTVIDVGGFPLALRILPGDRYAVITDGAYGDEALRIVDLNAKDPHAAVVSTHDYPLPPDVSQQNSHAPALFLGLALSHDGKRVYASNGGFDPIDSARPSTEHENTIDVFDLVGDPPQLVRNDKLTIQLLWNASYNKDVGVKRLPAGITLSTDEKWLYVATQGDNTLAVVSLAEGADWGVEIGRAQLPGMGAYDVAVDEASHLAFVSLWGGQAIGAANFVDGIAVVDVSNPRAPLAMASPLPTGKSAEAELIVAGRLYVTNADVDSLSVVDIATKAVRTMPVTASMLVGASPNGLAVDVSASRLYVADAGENAVVVMDLETLAIQGRIPTAWYPTAVAVRSDGSLAITSAKGLGLGPTDVGPSPSYMRGVVQVVPRPSLAELVAGDALVAKNFDRPHGYQAALACPDPTKRLFPVPPDDAPAKSKPATPIEHVFLIVRENKTYDAILGDLETGNGKKEIVLFGEKVTPNAHALSRAFVTVDNFYSLAEQSLQGHEWTTAAISNDFTEKAWGTTWGRAWRDTSAFGSGPALHLSRPASDTIWTHLDKAQVAYHNYGEIVNTDGAKIVLDFGYPGVFFNLDKRDVDKIQFVIDAVTDPSVVVEPFSYIGLPNDHTYGTSAGKQTPQSMVADNDEATGRFIDALSHSSLWMSSVVFVIEDDPSDGGDHVEPHRSILMCASPWIKRGYRSSVNYDVPALYRTIELILGLAPMNLNDAHAPAMYDLFSDKPDATPYTFIPRSIPVALNTADAPLSDESAKIDFSKPDQAPLGRILWKATHGASAEPPWNRFRVRDLDGD